MTPERRRKIQELYQAALERDPSERSAFLAEACRGDEELKREADSLLLSGGKRHRVCGNLQLATDQVKLAKIDREADEAEEHGHKDDQELDGGDAAFPWGRHSCLPSARRAACVA
jgi:hypothetical protein